MRELGDFPAAPEYCEKDLKIDPEEDRGVKFRGYVLEFLSGLEKHRKFFY